MKVAVVGIGSIGSRHARVLSGIAGGSVCAVPVRPSRLPELRSAGFQTAPDIRSAAKWGASLAIIATNTSRHLKDSISAMERGLDVLVEKPLAVDSREARLLCERAEKLGRKVYVGCVMRFSESLNKFRDLLDRIGRLHSVRIECQSYLPDWRPTRPYKDSYSSRSGEGGVLRDLIHEIDYAGWLFGWPRALQANVRNLGRLGIEGEEIAELMWEGPSRVTVSLTLDYLSRPHRRRMMTMGELGTLEWDGIEGTVTLALADTPSKVFRSSQTRDETFLCQATAFINAQRGHCDPRLTTGEEGVKALAICDAARRASASRREELVEYS